MSNLALSRKPALDALLDELDEHVPAFIAERRPERLAAAVEAARDADLRERPWAGLLVSAAQRARCDSDARVAELLEGVEVRFRSDADDRGLGFVAYVRGAAALDRGDVAAAVAAWAEARRRLADEAVPLDAVAYAHLSLAHYTAGRLHEALVTAEQALALARRRRNCRAEALSLLYLAFLSLWAGSFDRSERLLTKARAVYREIEDSFERFECPLVEAGFGVLHALRGQRQLAERAFLTGLQLSETIDAPWFGAIVRTLRAEFCAPWRAVASMEDARDALDALEGMNDTYWTRWARRALAVADMYAGNTRVSVEALRRLLDEAPDPLERTWTLITLSECAHRAGEPGVALDAAWEALRLSDGAASCYLQARVRCVLAEIDQANREIWRQRARDLMDDDVAYRALLTASRPLHIEVFGPGRVLLGDRPVKFATRHAEAAVVILAFVGRRGINAEALAERLWPNVGATVWSGRVRTLLWQVRRALGPEAWRVERDGRVVRMELAGAVFDFAELCQLADAALVQGVDDGGQTARLLAIAEQPLLTAYQYDEWVVEPAQKVEQLRDRLATVATREP